VAGVAGVAPGFFSSAAKPKPETERLKRTAINVTTSFLTIDSSHLLPSFDITSSHKNRHDFPAASIAGGVPTCISTGK
jgi:hypothetical protein